MIWHLEFRTAACCQSFKKYLPLKVFLRSATAEDKLVRMNRLMYNLSNRTNRHVTQQVTPISYSEQMA